MLKGKVIINTRPAGSKDPIGSALEELGATVLSLPLIEIHPVELPQYTLEDITKGKYQWLVFTSRNGVRHFFNQLKLHPNTAGLLFNTAVFGTRTALALEKFGGKANIINQGNSAVDLIGDLTPVLQPDDKVLLVLGNLAADHLQESLTPIISVKRLNVYQTDFVRLIDAEILQRIVEDNYDLILFGSPSGYNSFKHHAQTVVNMKQLKAACLGPTTEKALLDDGITPLVVASPTGKAGLINGIKNLFVFPPTAKLNK
jgi:uroporphyrinogen-III synthase